MPKATKRSAQVEAQASSQQEANETSQEDLTSSDQETDPEVTFNPPRQPQVVPSMFMSYIEGPKMDWTVNDGLYHRFLKWCLKCENILECELAALPERQQCKKMIAWSWDFSMDQYVSWDLPTDQLTLERIWGKFEEFCKPQSNEIRARFTFSQASGRAIEVLTNGTVWCKLKSIYLNTLLKLPRSCKGTSFGFS